MRQAISRLLGIGPRKGSGPLNGKPASSQRRDGPTMGEGRDNPLTIEDNSENGTRRQLVQMLLRECLNRNGMVPGSVECQMTLVSSRSRGPGMHIRLIMRRWDLRLLTYAVAFQKELMNAITQFEPKASTWLHGISWEFHEGETCPYPDMPDPLVWKSAPLRSPSALAEIPVLTSLAAAVALPVAVVAPAAVAAPAARSGAPQPSTPEDEVSRDLRDLHNMFAARDASIEQERASGANADFADTEPSGLH